MKDFGSVGMDLYVLDERAGRVTPDVEHALPEVSERRSPLTRLGVVFRNSVARLR